MWSVPKEDPPWSGAMGCWTALVQPYIPELVLGRSARSVWLSPSGAAALLVCTPEQVLSALAPSAQERGFSLEAECAQSIDGVDPLLLQIFNELDQAGSMLARETLEDELPMHNGKGDVRKCPYYADKQDKGRSCMSQASLPGWLC